MNRGAKGAQPSGLAPLHAGRLAAIFAPHMIDEGRPHFFSQAIKGLSAEGSMRQG